MEDSNTKVQDFTEIFAEIDKVYGKAAEQRASEYLKEIAEKLPLQGIAKEVSVFLHECNEVTSTLDYEIKQNKEKTYISILVDDIEQTFKEKNLVCNEEAIQVYKSNTLNRIIDLVSCMKNPEVLLGVEYMLSKILDKEKLRYEYNQMSFKEGYDSLEDIHDSEALQNIDNHLAR